MKAEEKKELRALCKDSALVAAELYGALLKQGVETRSTGKQFSEEQAFELTKIMLGNALKEQDLL